MDDPLRRRTGIALTGAVRATLLATAMWAALWMAASANAAVYVPPPGKVFAGLTGGYSIESFEKLVGHHPPVFERFVRWDTGTDWLGHRRSTFRARLGVALTTAVAKYQRAVVSSEQIALGRSDRFLIAMNQHMAHAGKVFYVRIMPEMNGWWNPYCPYNEDGSSRGRAFSQHFFIEAWRRTVLILRGGHVRQIDRKLRALGLPPIRRDISPTVLPQPKVAFMWVPQTRGDPEISSNLPGRFWPGRKYVDWVGTDFFSPWPNWDWLDPFYRRYAGEPFVLGEWGVAGVDNPQFVRDVFAWIRTHRRLRMLNYNQGFGAADPHNPAHYPKSMAMLRRELASPKFPQYAPEYRNSPPPGRSG